MKSIFRYFVITLVTFVLLLHPSEAQADTLLAMINNLRASVGVAPYTMNSALNVAAQSHAQWMADTQQISHTQFNGSTPRTRAVSAGYSSSWVSENIYGGTRATIESAWNFWINSPIHYRGLTNASYADIGIGIASGNGSNYFVLVFGNPGGSVTTINTGNAGNNSGGNAGNGSNSFTVPPFVVGQDNFGNIMHEIQEGQTIGDIALIYGYTWDDVPRMLELNGMSDAEIRLLQPGGIFLVPPYSGTYTPTAPPEGWSSPAPNYSNEDIINTAIAFSKVKETEAFLTQRASVLLTPVSTPKPGKNNDQSDEGIGEIPERVSVVGTSSSAPLSLLDTATATMTPLVTATPTLENVSPVAQASVTQGIEVAVVSTPPPLRDVVITTGGDSSSWILLAVAVSSLFILGAAFEYWRRTRSS